MRDEVVQVSVCLATWNGERHLRQQIDSVLSQLSAGDELIVADDGSTDETLAILAGYGDRLRVVATGRVGGAVRNFERVLAAARGELIALCDQDDVWLKGKLDVIRAHLQEVDMIMMDGDVVDSELRPIGLSVYEFVSFRGGFARTFMATKYVGCCMAFRRRLLEVALPFPARIQWHDWYLALVGELLFSHEISSVKTILFRRHEGNASTTGKPSSRGLLRRFLARVWMARAILVASFRFVSR